jgi:hypothetical protein
LYISGALFVVAIIEPSTLGTMFSAMLDAGNVKIAFGVSTVGEACRSESDSAPMGRRKTRIEQILNIMVVLNRFNRRISSFGIFGY